MGDLYATIHRALGIDWKRESMNSIGQPVTIANAPDDETGQSIKELTRNVSSNRLQPRSQRAGSVRFIQRLTPDTKTSSGINGVPTTQPRLPLR